MTTRPAPPAAAATSTCRPRSRRSARLSASVANAEPRVSARRPRRPAGVASAMPPAVSADTEGGGRTVFVQVIQGKVSDPEKAKAALDRWNADVADGAIGYLGTTAGVTADGTLRGPRPVRVGGGGATRTASGPSRTPGGRRPPRLFDGEPTFRDSTKVQVDMYGATPMTPASSRSCRARARTPSAGGS